MTGNSNCHPWVEIYPSFNKLASICRFSSKTLSQNKNGSYLDFELEDIFMWATTDGKSTSFGRTIKGSLDGRFPFIKSLSLMFLAAALSDTTAPYVQSRARVYFSPRCKNEHDRNRCNRGCLDEFNEKLMTIKLGLNRTFSSIKP